MLSVQEINLLRAQNEGLIKQNKELQAQNRKLKRQLEKPVSNNNYERIKQLTVDEMAKEFTKITATYCEYCPFQKDCEGQEIFCKDYLKQWLLAEE